jgi:20S proteasome alpha/beta subunit
MLSWSHAFLAISGFDPLLFITANSFTFISMIYWTHDHLSPSLPIRTPWLPQILADRVSAYKQAYTCYGSVRPFGLSTLIGGIDKTGPKLFCIEPSGVYYGYRACAVGKGKALAKTELEKIVSKEGEEGYAGLNVREGVMEVARMWVQMITSWDPC